MFSQPRAPGRPRHTQSENNHRQPKPAKSPTHQAPTGETSPVGEGRDRGPPLSGAPAEAQRCLFAARYAP